MTRDDIIAKLGYTLTTTRILVSNDNKHYTRKDIQLRSNTDPTEIHTFRDRSALELFIQSKMQLEIPQGAAAKRR